MKYRRLARRVTPQGVGRPFRRVAQTAGLTQLQLADKGSLQAVQIPRYENHASKTSLDAVREFAIALNASVETLMFNADERAPNSTWHCTSRRAPALARRTTNRPLCIPSLLFGSSLCKQLRLEVDLCQLQAHRNHNDACALAHTTGTQSLKPCRLLAIIPSHAPGKIICDCGNDSSTHLITLATKFNLQELWGLLCNFSHIVIFKQ